MSRTFQKDHEGEALLPKQQLGRIWKAVKALNMDEDDFRALLERLFGFRSTKQLTADHLLRLQQEFRRLGWNGYLKPWTKDYPNNRNKYKDMDRRPDHPTGAQLRKLEAMFFEIPGYGTIDPPKALRKFLENRFGVSDIRFLNDEQYQKALNAIRDMRVRAGLERD